VTPYKVCVVGGWCGNRMVMVAQFLAEWLAQAGYPSRVFHHSIWESFAAPPPAHLVLQLLPAFTAADTHCPVLLIRPLLRDLDHPETLKRVLLQVSADYPCVTGSQPASAPAAVQRAR
jgi:hypothetical protein